MVRRHGRRSVDPDAPVVDLDRVLADDLAIDRIGQRPWAEPGVSPGQRTAGAHRASGRHHRGAPAEPLFDLLDDWRLELAVRPMPEPVAMAPPPPRDSPGRHRRRRWRPAVAVAAAIGAVVVATATVGAANADPASPFWPITQAIWPNRAQSIESTRQIRAAIVEAEVAMGAGRSRDARLAIERAVAELDGVDDAMARDSLRVTVNQLWERSAASAPDRSAVPGALPSMGVFPVGAPVPVTGRAAVPGEPAAASIAATTSGPVGTDVIAGLVHDRPSGSSSGPGAPATSPVPAYPSTPSPEGPAASSPGQSTADPAAPTSPSVPATLPPPSVVVEPAAGSGASTAPPTIATQQSAPVPTQTQATVESPAADGKPSTERVTGTDGAGGESPAVDAPVPAAPTTGAAPTD